MATGIEEKKIKCQHCGSEEVECIGKYEEEQYGLDGEGGGTGRTYVGTEIKRQYLCKKCNKISWITEIKKD